MQEQGKLFHLRKLQKYIFKKPIQQVYLKFEVWLYRYAFLLCVHIHTQNAAERFLAKSYPQIGRIASDLRNPYPDWMNNFSALL